MSDEIEIRQWVKRGNSFVNVNALDVDDPDYIYNQIMDQGKIPEEYGIYHPYALEFENKNREELIHEIVNLRKEVTSLHRASAAGWI